MKAARAKHTRAGSQRPQCERQIFRPRCCDGEGKCPILSLLSALAPVSGHGPHLCLLFFPPPLLTCPACWDLHQPSPSFTPSPCLWPSICHKVLPGPSVYQASGSPTPPHLTLQPSAFLSSLICLCPGLIHQAFSLPPHLLQTASISIAAQHHLCSCVSLPPLLALNSLPHVPVHIHWYHPVGHEFISPNAIKTFNLLPTFFSPKISDFM